jgi:hypothetical protein
MLVAAFGLTGAATLPQAGATFVGPMMEVGHADRRVPRLRTPPSVCRFVMGVAQQPAA